MDLAIKEEEVGIDMTDIKDQDEVRERIKKGLSATVQGLGLDQSLPHIVQGKEDPTLILKDDQDEDELIRMIYFY